MSLEAQTPSFTDLPSLSLTHIHHKDSDMKQARKRINKKHRLKTDLKICGTF